MATHYEQNHRCIAADWHGPRSYSPGLACWITQARLEEQLRGEHPYSYAQNNPILYTDPSGLTPACPAADDCKDHPWVPGWYDNNQDLRDAIRAALKECPEFHPGVMNAILFCIVARETRGWKDRVFRDRGKGMPHGPCQIVEGKDKDRICKGLDWRNDLKDHIRCCARILCWCLKKGGGNIVKGCGTTGSGMGRNGTWQVINESGAGYDPTFKCCLKRLGWTVPTQDVPRAK